MADNDDLEARNRIIAHMNQAHQDSLSRFVEYYCHKPVPDATARLDDLTPQYMILSVGDSASSSSSSSAASRYFVPLDPPLPSWRNVRERMRAMDEEALAGLGRSGITVDRYLPPRGFHAVVLVACVVTFLTFCRRGNLLPGSMLYDHVLAHVPSFAAFCRRVRPILFPCMLLIHSTEVIWFDYSRLAKYHVPRWSRLWWTWIISNFLEGYGAYQRLDRLVRSYKIEESRGK